MTTSFAMDANRKGGCGYPVLNRDFSWCNAITEEHGFRSSEAAVLIDCRGNAMEGAATAGLLHEPQRGIVPVLSKAGEDRSPKIRRRLRFVRSPF